jgi:hypothetical protein
VLFFFPETKVITLEDMQKSMDSGVRKQVA